MHDEDWIIIEVGRDAGTLRIDAEKLRKCYPDRYDIRITPIDPERHFALAVRHRD